MQKTVCSSLLLFVILVISLGHVAFAQQSSGVGLTHGNPAESSGPEFGEAEWLSQQAKKCAEPHRSGAQQLSRAEKNKKINCNSLNQEPDNHSCEAFSRNRLGLCGTTQETGGDRALYSEVEFLVSVPRNTLMYRSGLISPKQSSIFRSLAAAAHPAWPSSPAAQKTALHLDGTPADPFLAAAGRPVVLIFVRTDCPISNRYAPLIQRISSEYGAKIGLWLVYPSRTASAEKIRQHERDYGYKLAALRDPQHALVTQAQVQITPEAAVFDANHHLLYHGRIDDLYQDFGRARPAATTHELDDAIQAALSGKTPPPSTPGVGCYIADLE